MPAPQLRLLTGVSEPGSRVVLTEVFELPTCDRNAEVGQEPLVEGDIMHGEEDGATHVGGEKKWLMAARV